MTRQKKNSDKRAKPKAVVKVKSPSTFRAQMQESLDHSFRKRFGPETFTGDVFDVDSLTADGILPDVIDVSNLNVGTIRRLDPAPDLDRRGYEYGYASGVSGSVSAKIVIAVYLDNGVVFEYDVTSHASAREHADAIVKTGYRRVEEGKFTHFPPHRILKVVAEGPGINTSYPDRMRGT